LLKGQEWPGNIRSLDNVFQRLSHRKDWTLDAIRRAVEIEHRGPSHPVAERTADGTVELSPDEQQLLDAVPYDRSVRASELAGMLAIKKNLLVSRMKRLLNLKRVRKTGRGPKTSYQRSRG